MRALKFSANRRGNGGNRIKCRLSWKSDEGVASTVGTIMAMMIFLTFLSLFTNQYVPIWMEDNEAAHMHTAESQFGELKQSIDIQILGGLLDEYELSLYTPVTLGAQGVPMFAAPTLGILSINPNPIDSSSSVEFYYNASGTGDKLIENQGSGNVQLLASNRYYVEQTLIYENDGIILQQENGQLFKAPPQFNLRKEGSRYHMSVAQITIMGDNESYAGSDTRGIQTRVRAAQSFTYEDAQVDNSGNPVDGIPDGGFIHINQTTKYGDAWESFYNNSCYDYGLVKGSDYFISKSVVAGAGTTEPTYLVSLRISTDLISSFTVITSSFDVTISDTGV